MDEVFKALADAHRRTILDRLHGTGGLTLGALCEGLDMSRQAVSKHLAVLEAANLVTAVKRGRERLHYLNPMPIGEIYDRWIGKYDRARVEALADLKLAWRAGPRRHAWTRPAFATSATSAPPPRRCGTR
jgi:DNA-binding transcriptional ArsR family regulator